MSKFRAIRIDKAEKGTTAAFTEFDETDLMDGDVTVRVSHSTVNYKDGLNITGKAPIARRFPMIPGIDFAGTVLTSDHAGFKAGDAVFFDEMNMHRTGSDPGMTNDRYALEAWFFAPSCYPMDQIPLLV